MRWQGSWCWGNRGCAAAPLRLTTPTLVIPAQARIHAGRTLRWNPAFVGMTAMETRNCSNQMADALRVVNPGRPPSPLVILAQARIHASWTHRWIPAFAGMTFIGNAGQGALRSAFRMQITSQTPSLEQRFYRHFHDRNTETTQHCHRCRYLQSP